MLLNDRAPDFIVGKVAARTRLAWSVANEFYIAHSELTAPMNRAALPTYSRLAADWAAPAREYRSVAGLVTLLVVPLVIGLARACFCRWLF